MAQVMYTSDALKILRRVPGLRAACADRTNKVQRSRYSIQEIGVYYRDRFICKIDQDFMDDVPHLEWLRSKTDVAAGTREEGTAYQYRRSAWPERMKYIESRLPRHLRETLRKVAWKIGRFKWS